MIKRLLTTALAGAALAAAGLAVATPAHAGPEDGQGCVGTPTIPLAYVCVISVNPTAAVPNVTTTPVPVTVPPVCYYAGCTTATTVNVPIPTGTSSGGNVIVLWHNGVYYPIAVETQGVVTLLVNTVDTTLDTAEYYAGVVLALYESVYGTVDGVVGGVVDDVDEVLTGLGKTLDRTIADVMSELEDGNVSICRIVEIVAELTGGQWQC